MREDGFLNIERPPFQVRRAESPADNGAYNTLLQATYNKLGFLDGGVDRFLPPDNAARFVLCDEDAIIGIFCLSDVTEDNSPFREHLPALMDPEIRALEVTNLVLEKQYRGSIGLPLLLYAAVQYALNTDYDFLVGIARYSALRAFVDAGAAPLYHPPLHVLGKPDIADFICYFDLRAQQDRDYVRQRALRLLQQIEILSALRRDFLKPNRCGTHPKDTPQKANNIEPRGAVKHKESDADEGV